MQNKKLSKKEWRIYHDPEYVSHHYNKHLQTKWLLEHGYGWVLNSWINLDYLMPIYCLGLGILLVLIDQSIFCIIVSIICSLPFIYKYIWKTGIRKKKKRR
ncbi:MAG: hypothetical protein ACFFG0_04335 [Candidatus Thorarchaeota archaeon]